MIEFKPKVFLLIGLIASVFFLTSCSANGEAASRAFNNGQLGYGSSYEDVVLYLGKPDDETRWNGKVSNCSYRDTFFGLKLLSGKSVYIMFSEFTDGRVRVTDWSE